jgi:hypothetical protein
MGKQINHGFAIWTNGGKRLDAAVAASTACGQNEERWFSHEFLVTSVKVLVIKLKRSFFMNS